MLKFENASGLDILKAYMATSYPSQDALVIDIDDREYAYQMMQLWTDLAQLNMPLPLKISSSGYVILTLNKTDAIKLCNKYKTDFYHMFVFHGGELLHQT